MLKMIKNSYWNLNVSDIKVTMYVEYTFKN